MWISQFESQVSELGETTAQKEPVRQLLDLNQLKRNKSFGSFKVHFIVGHEVQQITAAGGGDEAVCSITG